jgi:CheY-like chemotaxis protein
MKALMIMPDMLASTVPDAFAKAGFKVQLSESGVFALTMLERDKPEVIVCADHLGDMSGREMHEIVRSDASLNEVLFILLDGAAEEKLLDSNKDLELSWMTSAGDIVRNAKDLLSLSMNTTHSAQVSSKPAAEKLGTHLAMGMPDSRSVSPRLNTTRDKSIFQTENTMKPRAVGASGTLEIFTLFDLAVSLTSNLKVGILHIRIAKEEGSIFFYKGALTHAELKGLDGEAALLAIFAMADEYKSDTEFIFEPLEIESLPPEASSIKTPIDKLLFTVAVELDHQREARKGKVEERV